MVAKTGEVFNRYGNGTEGLTTYYGYDDRSQLTSEVTKVGTGSTVLTGRDNGFAYDTMGNRSSTSGTTHNSNSANYTTNALNQYTQRTVPGVFDVAGAAGSGATVTVNSSSSGVTRHGEYFFKGHALTNTSNPVFSTLTVSDGTTSFNLDAFLALTPEAFTYDDDGNLLTDGRWSYSYDAENRLIAMETTSAAYGAGAPRQKLQFTYDYLGRRVDKLVSNWNGSSWSPASERRFIYDGWNLLLEMNALSSLAKVRAHVWGLDLSGTLQGAGGVGGLLSTYDYAGGNSYLPAYDGNGNIHGMIKASDGSLAAAYEYDAFGQTLRESGPYAASNPFRFATKYADPETGLVQYNTRYYSPTLGRFLNRDTISEQGGLNLYAYCGNNGVNRWDYLGNVAQDQYIAAPGDDEFDVSKLVIRGTRGNFISWADGYAFTKEAGDDFSATGFSESAEYHAVLRDQAKLASIQDTLDSGGTVTLRDANGNLVYLPAGSATTATFNFKNYSSSISSSAPNNTPTGSPAGSSGRSGLGDLLRRIPGVGSVLGFAGDVVAGTVGLAANIVTLGHASQWHYSRNAQNDAFLSDQGLYGRANISLSELPSALYTRASPWETGLHRNGPGNEGNLKYTTISGGSGWNRYGTNEIVLRPNNDGSGSYTHVRDSNNMGTLNRGGNPISHFFVDIIPYLIFGNTPPGSGGG